MNIEEQIQGAKHYYNEPYPFDTDDFSRRVFQCIRQSHKQSTGKSRLPKRFIWPFIAASACVAGTVVLGVNQAITASVASQKTKELAQIRGQMEQSINHFNSLSGTYVTLYNGSEELPIEFSWRVRPNPIGYSVKAQPDGSQEISRFDGRKWETYTTGTHKVMIQNVDKGLFAGGPEDLVLRPVTYENYLTELAASSISKTAYLGRSATRVDSLLPTKLVKKFEGAVRVSLTVDNATGVLLEWKTTKGDGTVVEHMYAKNLIFNQPIDDSKSKIVIPQGYTR